MQGIRENAELAVRAFLKKTHAERHGEPLQAIDYMDDGTVRAPRIGHPIWLADERT